MNENQSARKLSLLQAVLRNEVETSWETESDDQRLEPRFKCIPTKGIACVGERLETAHAEVHDVSGLGLHLVLDRPIALGSPVAVELTGMVVAGEIRYCRPNGAASFDAGLKIGTAQRPDRTPARGQVVEIRTPEATPHEQFLRRARFVLMGSALLSLALFLRRSD